MNDTQARFYKRVERLLSRRGIKVRAEVDGAQLRIFVRHSWGDERSMSFAPMSDYWAKSETGRPISVHDVVTRVTRRLLSFAILS